MWYCSVCAQYYHEADMSSEHMCKACDNIRAEYMKAESLAKEQQQHEEKYERYFNLQYKPSDVKKHLDQYVIGQTEVKKTLATAMVNHMYTVYHNSSDPEIFIKPNVVLITGPTGSGKTLSVSHMADLFKIPMVSVDCTSLTASGYVGQDVEEIFAPILEEKASDPQWDGTMVVYLDEIDKIAASPGESGKDVNGKAVQQALLKIIEGSEVRVQIGNKWRGGGQSIGFQSSNVLYILSGAFTDVREMLDKKASKKPIGFERKSTRNHYKITSKDIIDAGMIRELVGRVTHIVEAKALSRNQMKRILTEPKDAILKQYDKLCELRRLDPISKMLNLDNIVDLAIKRKVGARGLRQIIEEKGMKHMYGDENAEKDL